jgi:hypothetical protein
MANHFVDMFASMDGWGEDSNAHLVFGSEVR